MATAIVPLVTAAVQLVIPLLPSLIQSIEALIGNGNGAQKKQAVVDMAKTGLDALANAGKIPSAGVVDPTLPAALGAAVQTVFDQLSVGGKIPGVTAPATAVSVANAALKAAVVSGAGRTFLVFEV